ncbi:hypothetical protein E4U42_001984 [Claviceps africana]|uniref:Uncharacterized protein n=1 Tax=Claviceps africana TaxID=83212 RepID=A0A8K0NDZ3_9HYPO|nr:hypothetical protein E4U42_001984 [Claviceps africana]
MAHLVARNPTAYPVRITGILLIDSPHHVARSSIVRPVARPQLIGLPDLVCTAFDHCDAMLQHWELPRWRGARAAACEVAVGGRRFRLRDSEVLYKPAEGGGDTWSTIAGGEATTDAEERAEAKTDAEEKAEAKKKAEEEAEESASLPGPPPPGVLLRCTRPAVPRPDGPPGAPCLVDLHRADKLLGWGGRHAGFIRAVIDVDADHYGLFDRTDMSRMEDVTARVAWGLSVLDGMGGGR